MLPGVLAACGVHAQEAPAAPVATVAVTGNAESFRRNDTAARIVITRDEIQKYGDASVLEVLKRLPGVSVNNGQVAMRGLGSGYTQVLVNGERQPASFSIESLSPESIERIEVLRAATAQFSTQAIAGTINIVLKRNTGKDASEVKVRTFGTQGGRAHGVNLATSGKSDSFSYTADAGLGHNTGTELSRERVEERTTSGQTANSRTTSYRNLNDASVLNLSSRLQWKLGGTDTLAWRVSATGARFHGRNDERTSTALGAPYPFPELDVRYVREHADLGTDLEWGARLGDAGKLTMKARAYSTVNERHIERQARNDGAETVLDRDYATDSRNEGLAWSGSVSFPWTDSHALAAGWDAGYGKLREHEVQDDAPSASGPAPIDFDNSFAASIHRLALYVQDEWEVTPALSAYLGVRWEGVDIRTSAAGKRATSRSRVWSPLMQLLWRIPGSDKDQLRFALTRTYKAPDLGRLVPRHFYTSFNSAVTPDYTGNPELRPELARGLDLAYERYWKAGAMVSASASVRRIDGLVRSAVRYDESRWLSYPENSGEALVRTVELEARFPLGALIPESPAVDVRASVSRNWSRVEAVPGPDNRLARQPRWSANVGLDYKAGAFNTGASLALVAGGWNRLSVEEWSYVSQRTELQAYALYRIAPFRQLRFTLSNLRPRDSSRASRYVDAGGSLESRTVSDSHAGWRLQYEHKF